jgi:hypothetical protein
MGSSRSPARAAGPPGPARQSLDRSVQCDQGSPPGYDDRHGIVPPPAGGRRPHATRVLAPGERPLLASCERRPGAHEPRAVGVLPPHSTPARPVQSSHVPRDPRGATRISIRVRVAAMAAQVASIWRRNRAARASMGPVPRVIWLSAVTMRRHVITTWCNLHSLIMSGGGGSPRPTVRRAGTALALSKEGCVARLGGLALHGDASPRAQARFRRRRVGSPKS